MTYDSVRLGFEGGKPRVHRRIEGPSLVIVPNTQTETFELFIKTGPAHSETRPLMAVKDVYWYPQTAKTNYRELREPR